MDATDKQKMFLWKNGINPEGMDKQTASKKIEELINKQTSDKSLETTGKPLEAYRLKPRTPAGSYYVSYSKDILIALLALEQNKTVSVEILMESAIKAILQA